MQLEGLKQIVLEDETEILRRILEKQEGISVTYDEALEIGESLLCYFKTLANEDGLRND